MSVPVIPPAAGGTGLIRSLLQADAVQLFVKRATAARSDFQVTEENVGDIVTICRLLDGLPLAIELAAARIGILSPRMLAQRLQHRLPLLDDGPRIGLDYFWCAEEPGCDRNLSCPARPCSFLETSIIGQRLTKVRSVGVCTFHWPLGARAGGMEARQNLA